MFRDFLRLIGWDMEEQDCGICPVGQEASYEQFKALFGARRPKIECPPTSEELGRQTWTFLHTMAAHSKKEPTEQEQQRMKTFLDAFSRVYPCRWCAEHMRQYLAEHPPRVESREALSRYMCAFHNEVNEHLGKPQFNCDLVFERWKESTDPACQS